MKNVCLIAALSFFLFGCDHGGSIGFDASKKSENSANDSSSFEREKSLSVNTANAKKETMPALLLLGDAMTGYVAPMFSSGAGKMPIVLGDYILDSDNKKVKPEFKNWVGVQLMGNENKAAIALMSASLSPMLGWPIDISPAMSFDRVPEKKMRPIYAYMTAMNTTLIFSNNLYAKAAARLNQTSLRYQGEAKDAAIDFILKLPPQEIEQVFDESLEQGRAITQGSMIDLIQKLGTVGWTGNGYTVYGDQAGWHLQRAGNSFFGGETINGKSITLALDNTLDNVMAKKKINSESTESTNSESTTANATLK